jgi:peroxiredoxin
MKKAISSLVLGLLLMGSGSAFADALGQGAPAPDFKIQLPDGKSERLVDLKGKVVVLDFWASWCPWCVKELPDVNQISQANGGVVVIGVNDEAAATIRQASADLGLTFQTVSDADESIATLYGVSALPNSVVIDANGKIAAVIEGYHDDGSLAHAVQNALTE